MYDPLQTYVLVSFARSIQVAGIFSTEVLEESQQFHQYRLQYLRVLQEITLIHPSKMYRFEVHH